MFCHQKNFVCNRRPVFECRLLRVSLVLGLSSGIISLQDIHSRFTVCASDNLTRSVVRYKFVTYFPDNTSTQHLTTLGLCVSVCLSLSVCDVVVNLLLGFVFTVLCFRELDLVNSSKHNRQTDSINQSLHQCFD